MKKAMLVCAGLASLCIASTAHAIPSFVNRSLVVSGTNLTLGTLNFVPLGAAGAFPGVCLYQVAWVSPTSPTDTQTCLVAESQSNFTPNCVASSSTFVDGAFVQSNTAQCTGFDLMGQAHPTQLLLGENAAGLTGIAIENIGGLIATFSVHLP